MELLGFCRKFSFEAICGMVSPSDPCCIRRATMAISFKGPIFRKPLFSQASLVCRLPLEHTPRRRTHARTWGPRRSLDHQPLGGQV